MRTLEIINGKNLKPLFSLKQIGGDKIAFALFFYLSGFWII